MRVMRGILPKRVWSLIVLPVLTAGGLLVGAGGPVGGAPAGYYLLARDGSVYPFGPCALRFSAVRSAAPFVGIATDPGFGSLPALGVRVHDVASLEHAVTGNGYILTGADGGVFAFGHGVRFCGSAAGHTVAPVTSSAPYGFSTGYWLLERNGQLDIFDAPFDGTSLSESGHPSSCG